MGTVFEPIRKGLVLHALNGLTSHEKERVREKKSPSHAHAHIASLVYTDVYTEHEYTRSLAQKHMKLWTHTHTERHSDLKIKGTMSAAETPEVYI